MGVIIDDTSKSRKGLDAAEYRFFGQIQIVLAESAKSIHELNLPNELQTICGVDAAYSPGNHVVTVATTLDTATGKVLEQLEYQGNATFPYVPGFFFLREGPFAYEVISKLRNRPSLVCFDAHGMAHPRHLGLATICGMALGIQSVGIAKSKLMGRSRSYKPEIAKLVDEKSRLLGFVRRGADGRKTYWSPGYAISTKELESVMLKYGTICLQSITESHVRARMVLHSNSLGQ